MGTSSQRSAGPQTSAAADRLSSLNSRAPIGPSRCTVDLEPVLASLLIAARMPTLQIDPKHGHPERFALYCFLMCGGSVAWQTVLAIVMTSGVDCERRKGNLDKFTGLAMRHWGGGHGLRGGPTPSTCWRSMAASPRWSPPGTSSRTRERVEDTADLARHAGRHDFTRQCFAIYLVPPFVPVSVQLHTAPTRKRPSQSSAARR